MIPFADEYATALDEIEEAKKQGARKLPELAGTDRPQGTGPARGLELRGHAAALARAGRALRSDLGRRGRRDPAQRRRKFADEFFDPKKALYEPEELTDLLGTRFLVRKIKDVPPHVPPLDEVRTDVSLAWKTAKARVAGREGRRDLAEELKKKGGAIKETTVAGIPRGLDSTGHAPACPACCASRFDPGTPEESPIPDVPYAGRRVPRRILRAPARRRSPSRPISPRPTITS